MKAVALDTASQGARRAIEEVVSSGELAVAGAEAMSHQAGVYAEHARSELALSVRTALIERLKPADEPELREIATDTLLAIGSELRARGSDAQAIAAWSRLVAGYGSASQESGVRSADQAMSDELHEESVKQNVIHALERLASMFLSEGRASGIGAERSRLCGEAKSRLERPVEFGTDRRRWPPPAISPAIRRQHAVSSNRRLPWRLPMTRGALTMSSMRCHATRHSKRSFATSGWARRWADGTRWSRRQQP